MFKLSQTKVLTIASTKGLHKILAQMLHKAGVEQVYQADSIAEAFELGREHSIDITLVDDNPPSLDGIDVTGAIRLDADSPDCYMPIIFLSRSNSIGRATQAVEAGVHVVMTQPFPQKRLLKNIANVLSNPPKFVCSDVYFGPDRKSLKGMVKSEQKQMFEERSSIQRQVDAIAI